MEKIVEKRKKKGTPKASGFLLFCKEKRVKIKKEKPELSFGDISKEVGKRWKRLSDDKKAEYNLQAKEERGKILEKECRQCNQLKNISEYYTKRATCKECVKILRRDYQAKNREKINAYSKKYRRENENARNHSIEYAKKWNKNNRERINKRDKERKETEPAYKLKKLLRDHVSKAVKKEWKSKRTLELLGCDIKTFKKWMESQFDENMIWSNHGDYWHIDHIIPIDAWDLTKAEDIKKCFHWSNMQPLEKGENMRKNNNILPDLIKNKEDLAIIFEKSLKISKC
jgi:hypothetical protein